MKQKRPSGRRRQIAASGGALALVAGTPFVWPGPAAAAPSTFEGTASAFGFDYLMSNKSIAAGVSPQFSGPAAQTLLTSLPSGTSFASFPYPGDVAVGVPGLLPALVSGLPQTPAYPFIVSSGLGEGRQEINQPGIAMRADTQDSNANAHAVFGTDGLGSVSDARVQVSGDTVEASAVARQSALSIGEQGEIGSVLSSASVTRGFDGKLEKVTHLTISGIRFPGLQFTMPPTTPAPAPAPGFPAFPQAPAPFAGMTFVAPTFGFYDGQFTVALPGLGPQQYAVDSAAVVSAFKAAGYEVSFTQPVETKPGVVGATFTLHWVAPAPPDNPLYSGPTDFSLVFGRATAAIDGGGGASIEGFGTSAGGATTGADAGTGVPFTGLPGAGPGVGVDSAGVGLTPGVSGTDGASTKSLPTANLVPTDRVRAASDADDLSIDTLSNLYWVLVVGGAIAIFSIPTLRILGARS